MNQPPIINPVVVAPIYDAKPVTAPQYADKRDVRDIAQLASDANILGVLNQITLGAILGFLAAALAGPLMTCAPMAIIAGGISIGAACGNSRRSTADSLIFFVLLVVAIFMAIYGFMGTQKVADSLRNNMKESERALQNADDLIRKLQEK